MKEKNHLPVLNWKLEKNVFEIEKSLIHTT